MQGGIASNIRRVQWTAIFNQQLDHRRGAYRSCSMQRVLAALVPNSTRGRRFVGKERTSHLEVALR